MGKRGPKPRPTTLHRLRGTYREDRHGRRHDPEAPGALLQPPPYLSNAQQARFREMLAMAPKGLLRKWDSSALAGFCVAESLLIEATEARKREEDNGALLDRSEHGQIIIDALVKLQLRALAAMKPYIAELGLSPTARSGMKLAADDDDGADPDRWDYLAEAAGWDEFDRLQRRARSWPPPKETAAEKRRHKRLMQRVRKTTAKLDGKSADLVDISAPTAAGPVAKAEIEPSKIIPEATLTVAVDATNAAPEHEAPTAPLTPRPR